MHWRIRRFIPGAVLPLLLTACSGGGGAGGAAGGGGAAPAGLINPTPAASVLVLDLTSLSSLTTLPAGPNNAAVLANNGASFFPVRVTPTVAARMGAGVIEELTLQIPELAVQAAFAPQEIVQVPDALFARASWAVGSKPLGNGGEIGLYLLNPAPDLMRYDTFGIWIASTGATVDSISLGALSLGAATPVDQIPRSGVATYDGVLNALFVGTFVGADVTALASATVDFSQRLIDFRTVGTTRQDLTTQMVSAAPGLDMSGTLTYASGTSAASGTLRTADGMSGSAAARFVGPAAAELGGTFLLTDPTDSNRLIGGFSTRAP